MLAPPPRLPAAGRTQTLPVRPGCASRPPPAPPRCHARRSPRASAARDDKAGPPTSAEELAGGEAAVLGALALVALLAGGVAVATVGFDESVAAAKETVSSFASFAADAGPGGYALFALAYGGMEVLLLPATPLALAAGALWPVLPATALCSCGALVGATTAFVLGRTVARSRVVKLMEGAPQLRRLDSLFSKDDARSAKFVLLLNLSPLASLQNLLNYAYGTTGVRLVPYMAASWVACLPRTWATVAAGSLAGQQLSGGGEGPDAGLLVGFAVAVCATIVVAREAKLALDAEAD